MALRIRDLTLGYDRHPAVHHLDLDLAPGSLTAVVGPNGAGKSTLLKGLTGELQPLEGKIDTEMARLAYLPQLSEVDRSFPIAVGAFVAMGLWHRVGAFGRVSGKDAARVAEALAAVGLTGFDRRPISALSGGQVQRVMFARLLLQDADPGGAKAAMKFIAFAQEPERQLVMFRMIGQGPANPAADALLPAEEARFNPVAPENFALQIPLDMAWYEENYGPALDTYLGIIAA